MKIYDISQELFHANVYPQDPIPTCKKISQIEKGDICNLAKLELGTHSGTHLDAPYHFYENGRTVDSIELFKCIGTCYVMELHGTINNTIETLIPEDFQRILIRGNIEILPDGAEALVKRNLFLLGVEGLTVGSENTIETIHKILLKAEIVILENLNLKEVPVGQYFLSAAPLKLGGLDGSPCRPVLIEV